MRLHEPAANAQPRLLARVIGVKAKAPDLTWPMALRMACRPKRSSSLDASVIPVAGPGPGFSPPAFAFAFAFACVRARARARAVLCLALPCL